MPSAAYAAVRAGFKRLRGVWFTLVQTSVAAGLAWYLAHDVLDHPQPFFAPIAAAMSLSISNVLRAQRTVQVMIGVTLGIGMGTLVQGLLRPGALAIAVPALIALSVAVLIGLPRTRDDVRQSDRRVVDPGAVLRSARIRTTARQVVRIAPRRWGLRDSVQAADHQAVHVALLAGSVLQLARAVVPAIDGCCDRLPQPVHAVLDDLAASTALADSDPAAATA